MPVLTARRRTTPGTALAFLLPLTLALAACGVLPGTNGHYHFDPAAVQESYDCLADTTFFGGTAPTVLGRAKGSVPEDFEPVEAVRCGMDLGDLSPTSGPVRQKIREDHLSGDLSELLAALTEPSNRSGMEPCTADMEIVPELWLVDAAGKAVNVRWPVNGCSKTKPATRKALSVLTVRETRLLSAPAPEPSPPKSVITGPAAPTAGVPQPSVPVK